MEFCVLSAVNAGTLWCRTVEHQSELLTSSLDPGWSIRGPACVPVLYSVKFWILLDLFPYNNNNHSVSHPLIINNDKLNLKAGPKAEPVV